MSGRLIERLEKKTDFRSLLLRKNMAPFRLPQHLALVLVALCATSVYAKELWSSTPASLANLIRTVYPVGNGKLGAMPQGGVEVDIVTLNVDSLWTGGPFQSSVYTHDSFQHS